MGSAESLLKLIPCDSVYRVSGCEILPPCCCGSVKLMCGKLHLLTICSSCSGQLPSYLAEPIICYNRLGATGIHRWMQPKETSQVIPRWWWWWVVVVVALDLYQYPNQSILLLNQLGDLLRENKLGVASRRHLKGLEKMRNLE